jgi:hypothetical protein
MRSKLKRVAKNILGSRLYQKTVNIKNRITLARLGYVLRRMTGTLNLQMAGIYHNTDKHNQDHTFSGLSYLNIYEKYISTLKNKSISLLEIGVKDGDSLRMWKSYFKYGQIFGIDIDPDCKSQEEERIQIEIGSQDDSDFLKGCLNGNSQFDIIIDDGSHINTMTIKSFQNLFYNRLKSGGIYIIEDLHCSYDKLQTDHNILEIWPGMKHNDPSKDYDNNRAIMNDFFLKMIHDLDHRNGEVQFLHFWAMTCIIKKV